MKRYTVLLSIFAMIPSVSTAEIHFENPMVDLGAIRAGRCLTHTVRFTNKGIATVQIVDVRGSCGCLHPKVSTQSLKAGETAAVTMTINPFGQPAGKHRWRAFLRYQTDGRTEQKTLEVTARLITDVTVQPARLTLYPNVSIQQTLTFYDLREKPLTISRVVTSKKWLAVQKPKPLRKMNGKWVSRFQLQSVAPIPSGKHDVNVTIYTDDANYRELQIPVTIIKRDDTEIQAIPNEVVLQTSNEVPMTSRLVRIRSRDGRMVNIDKIECGHPAFQCRWANGPGRFTTLRIQVDGSKMPEKKWNGRLRVHIAEPVAETLELNVICVAE